MNVLLSGGAVALIIVGVIVLLAIIVIGWWISTANSLRQMQVKIDEAESGIDVALTKRFDLLTKALAAVKGYAKHEAETLEKVIAMRTGKGSSMAEKAEFANQSAEALKQLNVVVEQYPTLKADTQFTALQGHIADVEEQLQAARRLYNSNVSVYNQKIVTFPASIVANSKGMTKRDFFEAEAAKRQDVKMEF